MLITFKSKAAADILMYEKHAKPLLDPLGKDVKRGIITADETAAAIARIEEEIAEDAARRAAEQAPADDDEAEEQPSEPAKTVSLATRAYPLLEMLRAAHKQDQDIVWGL